MPSRELYFDNFVVNILKVILKHTVKSIIHLISAIPRISPVSDILAGPPRYIIWFLSSRVLLHQLYACLLGLVETLEPVSELREVTVHVQVRLPLTHLLLLLNDSLEKVTDRCVVS